MRRNFFVSNIFSKRRNNIELDLTIFFRSFVFNFVDSSSFLCNNFWMCETKHLCEKHFSQNFGLQNTFSSLFLKAKTKRLWWWQKYTRTYLQQNHPNFCNWIIWIYLFDLSNLSVTADATKLSWLQFKNGHFCWPNLMLIFTSNLQNNVKTYSWKYSKCKTENKSNNNSFLVHEQMWFVRSFCFCHVHSYDNCASFRLSLSW